MIKVSGSSGGVGTCSLICADDVQELGSLALDLDAQL
jgi:hypothetical protein